MKRVIKSSLELTPSVIFQLKRAGYSNAEIRQIEIKVRNGRTLDSAMQDVSRSDDVVDVTPAKRSNNENLLEVSVDGKHWEADKYVDINEFKQSAESEDDNYLYFRAFGKYYRVQK